MERQIKIIYFLLGRICTMGIDTIPPLTIQNYFIMEIAGFQDLIPFRHWVDMCTIGLVPMDFMLHPGTGIPRKLWKPPYLDCHQVISGSGSCLNQESEIGTTKMITDISRMIFRRQDRYIIRMY